MANSVLDQLQERAARIDGLKSQHKASVDAANAILAAARNAKRPMNAEEQTQFDTHASNAEAINATITAEERAASIGNIPTDKPVPTAATGIRVAVHDNFLDKPWGPERRSTETEKQRFQRLTIGFGEQLLAIRSHALWQDGGGRGAVPDARLFDLQERAAAAGASEAVPADGGFLVYPDFAAEVFRLTHDTGLVYTRAREIPISAGTNAIKIPRVDEQSRVDGSRWGGVRALWENEADALVGSKPKFGLMELILKKLTALFYATNELLADASALGAIVMQAFAEEMAFKLDDGCIRGTGAGQLQGVLKSAALVSVTKETGQAAATLVTENIDKMWARLWPRSHASAVWFANVDTQPQLAGLVRRVGTAGQADASIMRVPVYTPPGPDGNSGTIYGRPVVFIEQADTVGTQGDLMLLDMSQYAMINKGGVQSAVSAHVRFLTDELTFRFIQRVDGQSLWATSITPFKGSNSLSPFVVLDSR